MKVYSLKLKILVPIVIVSLLVTIIFITSFYYKEQQHLAKDLKRSAQSVEELFQLILEERAQKLEASLSLIIENPEIMQAMANRDRPSLLTITTPLFKVLRSQQNITHFYFHDPLRMNVLRVHQPERYGDLIDRHTASRAEQTKETAYGIELGPLGTLTLRVVFPVWNGDTLLGYVELGEEVDGIVKAIQGLLNLELFVVIDKKYLQQADWEAGMSALERKGEWNQFSNQVLISQTLSEVPPNLGEFLEAPNDEISMPEFAWQKSNKNYRGHSLALKDVSGRTVGSIILLRDMSESIKATWQEILSITAITLSVGLLLLVAFYFVLGRTERQLFLAIRDLENSKRDLSHIQHLAHIGSWEFDIKTSVMIPSDDLYDLLEVESQQSPMTLDDLMEFVHADDREKRHHAFKGAIEEGIAYQIEYRVVMLDGRIKYIHESSELSFNEFNQPVHATIIVQDITEQRRATTISERLGRIFEHSWNEIYMFDANDFHYIDASRGGLNNLGYSLEELKALTLFDIRADISKEKFLNLAEPLLSGKTHQVTFETTHQRKDGTHYPAEVRLQLSREEAKPVYISIIQDITERKSYIQKLEHKALFDNLTQLPNRFLLLDRLDQAVKVAQRDNSTLGIFIVDIARLRMINDVMGYHNGDVVLKQVAKRLVDELRDSDTVARLTDGQFSIIMPSVSIDNVYSSIDKLISILDKPFIVDGSSIETEAVMGVSFYPNHGEDPDELIRHADIAMHLARKQMKRFNIYQSVDNLYNLKRLKRYGELREAIGQKELQLYYQPKVDLKSGNVKCVEALARWPHPEEGLISPLDFIPIIEKTGLIQPFTRWVLEEAIGQSKIWFDQGIDIAIAINLSARNLLDPELPSYIDGLLTEKGLSPDRLVLEITESSVMANPEVAIKLLDTLHEMGLMLSIDDFGTGYSSLSYLKKLPVQELKIDQSFIFNLDTDEDSAVIVKSTIDLAHNLGLVVIAEGIETEDVLRLLSDLGCDIGQGYLFSKPLTEPVLMSWLKEFSLAQTN